MLSANIYPDDIFLFNKSYILEWKKTIIGNTQMFFIKNS